MIPSAYVDDLAVPEGVHVGARSIKLDVKVIPARMNAAHVHRLVHILDKVDQEPERIALARAPQATRELIGKVLDGAHDAEIVDAIAIVVKGAG